MRGRVSEWETKRRIHYTSVATPTETTDDDLTYSLFHSHLLSVNVQFRSRLASIQSGDACTRPPPLTQNTNEKKSRIALSEVVQFQFQWDTNLLKVTISKILIIALARIRWNIFRLCAFGVAFVVELFACPKYFSSWYGLSSEQSLSISLLSLLRHETRMLRLTLLTTTLSCDADDSTWWRAYNGIDYEMLVPMLWSRIGHRLKVNWFLQRIACYVGLTLSVKSRRC